MSERPPIPDPVKRAVRQRCCFGCVLCGLPLYQYDHVVDYSLVEEHEPENITLLCDRHHREKTNGLVPLADAQAANETPHNCEAEESAPYTLYYSGDHGEAVIGSNRHAWPKAVEGECVVPLLIDDTPIVMFRAEQGHLLLTVQLFDAANELLVQIVDNELVYSTQAWDVELVGRTLTARTGYRDIFVRMTFDPPALVTIDRAHVWRNGIEIDVGSGRLLVNGVGIADTTIQGFTVGVTAGLPPYGLGLTGVYTAVERSEYRAETPREQKVIRLSAGGQVLLPN